MPNLWVLINKKNEDDRCEPVVIVLVFSYRIKLFSAMVKSHKYKIPNVESFGLRHIEMYFTSVQLIEKGLINKISVMNPLKKVHYKTENIHFGYKLMLSIISANFKYA